VGSVRLTPSESTPGLAPVAESQAAPTGAPGRPHLVVVVTRAIRPEDGAPAGTVLLTRFWHPRDHCWSENFFQSLEHALRLFLDESGWTLRQQQALADPYAYELIFDARRQDFTGPRTEQILGEVGLTPQDVADLLNRVERPNR
jgi:hypothetical protein